VAEPVAQTMRPRKMNYDIHGHTIPHLHMHLFPRFDGDPFEGGPSDAAHVKFSRTAAEGQPLLQPSWATSSRSRSGGPPPIAGSVTPEDFGHGGGARLIPGPAISGLTRTAPHEPPPT
jgi:hypothetical protein